MVLSGILLLFASYLSVALMNTSKEKENANTELLMFIVLLEFRKPDSCNL